MFRGAIAEEKPSKEDGAPCRQFMSTVPFVALLAELLRPWIALRAVVDPCDPLGAGAEWALDDALFFAQRPSHGVGQRL